jgi:hypothetical protein
MGLRAPVAEEDAVVAIMRVKVCAGGPVAMRQHRGRGVSGPVAEDEAPAKVWCRCE